MFLFLLISVSDIFSIFSVCFCIFSVCLCIFSVCLFARHQHSLKLVLFFYFWCVFLGSILLVCGVLWNARLPTRAFPVIPGAIAPHTERSGGGRPTVVEGVGLMRPGKPGCLA